MIFIVLKLQDNGLQQCFSHWNSLSFWPSNILIWRPGSLWCSRTKKLLVNPGCARSIDPVHSYFQICGSSMDAWIFPWYSHDLPISMGRPWINYSLTSRFAAKACVLARRCRRKTPWGRWHLSTPETKPWLITEGTPEIVIIWQLNDVKLMLNVTPPMKNSRLGFVDPGLSASYGLLVVNNGG